MSSRAHIRRARPGDEELDALRELEQRAARRFREFAAAGRDPDLDAILIAIAASPPMRREQLERAREEDALWVLADADDRPLGFAVSSVVDGRAHLDELSVALEHGGRGHGGRLLEHVCTIARARGFSEMSLTTFRDVPWNAPFYARRGFAPMRREQLGPELRAIQREEQARGLAARHRVCMRRSLRTVTGSG